MKGRKPLSSRRGLRALLCSTALSASLMSGAGLLAAGLLASDAAASDAAPAQLPTLPSLPDPLPPPASQTWHLDMIGAGIAYGRGYTGAGVTVAVGDTGFDTTHPALAAGFDLSRALSFILNHPDDPFDPAFVGPQAPGDEHGTHVSGIIGARKVEDIAMHGVAYDATIVPIRVILDPDSAPHAVYAPHTQAPTADAFAYFASLPDVKVFNASFGPGADPRPVLDIWSVEPDAEPYGVYAALQQDKIVVASTGNDHHIHPAGRNASGIGLYPFIRPGHADAGVYDDAGAGLDYSPMLYGSGLVVAVMSLGDNKAPAYYSNFCGVTASWCVAAPGGDMVFGQGVYSTIPYDTYTFLQGTSMAAPVVTGAFAVLIGAYPDYSARELARVMFSTAEDLGAPGLDAVFGHGLVRLDRATDGPTTLADGAGVNVATDRTDYWSQPLVTDGAFTKDGEGVLAISGRTTAAGDVQVALGTLAVDGTLIIPGAGHTLSVDRAAMLAGFGIVRGNAAIAGTLSPGKMANVGDLVAAGTIASGADIEGNSAGQISFEGNVLLTETAVTRIDVDGGFVIPGGPGTHDRIAVLGEGHTFTINGTLTPVLRGSVGTPSEFTPDIGHQFYIIEAFGGAEIAGAFAGLAQPAEGLPDNGRFDVIYAPAATTLAVTPDSFAALFADPTRAQEAVAGILESQRPAAGIMPEGDHKVLYDALYRLTSAEDHGTAITGLGAPGQPAASAAPLIAFSSFSGLIGDRQNALLSGTARSQSGSSPSVAFAYAGQSTAVQARQAATAFASMTPAVRSPYAWDVWAQAFGRWSKVAGLPDASSSTDSSGFVLGADRLITSDVVGGAAFGFARSTTWGGGMTSTSDTYAGSVYASWMPGNAVFDIRAAAGPSHIGTERNIILTPGRITGSAGSFGGLVSAEAGYQFAAGFLTAKPFAGVTWQGLRRDGYSESQQPFGLVYPRQTYDKLTTTLGLTATAEHQFAGGVTLRPELKVAWAYDLRDTTLTSQAALLDSAFTIVGANSGRDAALVGVKLAGWTHESFRLFASYQGEYRARATSHQVAGGVRYSW